MILDICNFIVEFGKLGLSKRICPDFLARRDRYARLRNDYAAHTRIGKVASIAELLEKSPRLLQDMLVDIVEVDVLASTMLEQVRDIPTKEIECMTGEQIDEVRHRLRATKLRSQEFYGDRYVDPGEREQWRAARKGGG